jgi:hypothetical protein
MSQLGLKEGRGYYQAGEHRETVSAQTRQVERFAADQRQIIPLDFIQSFEPWSGHEQ